MTPDEFVAALEGAIAHDTPQKRQAHMDEARNHSWSARFAQIDRFIEEVLERKRAEEQRNKGAVEQGCQGAEAQWSLKRETWNT